MHMDEINARELRVMLTAWRALSARWGLDFAERRALFPDGGEEDGAPPADTERRMRILIEIGHRLRFDGNHLREWLREPSHQYCWLSPLQAMADLPHLRHIRKLAEAGAIL